MTDKSEVAAMAQDYGARLKSEAKFRSPQKAKPKPVTTITITFERMPGLPSGLDITFTKQYIRFINNEERWVVKGKSKILKHDSHATLHPNEKFDWEIGMKVALKHMIIYDMDAWHSMDIYRAFRRWIWLEKQAWELGTAGGCDTALADDMCDYYKDIIAREFGRVTVRVT